jgi:hypothetical protein
MNTTTIADYFNEAFLQQPANASEAAGATPAEVYVDPTI